MRTFVATLILSAAASGSGAAEQDTLSQARAQYEGAAYEEALATLSRLDGAPGANRVEIEQYRAFCELALGRVANAEGAIAALVAADPMYVPSSNIASPTVISSFVEIRERELPGAARRLLDAARAAYKDKDLARAERDFALLLKVLDDPALAGRPEREDLRTVADGFLSLLHAASAAAPASDDAGPATATEARDIAADILVPAVAVAEALPPWEPPNRAAATQEYVGAVRVRIGVDGKVNAVTIERRSYPAYDVRLLQAARGWVYRPATRNGTPVESEKVVAVRLRPRG